MALNFTNPMTGDAFKEELEKALDTTTGGVIKGDIYKESQNDENKYVIQQEFHRELANIEDQCIIADVNIQKINNDVKAINQTLGSYATKSALEDQYIVFDNRLLPLEEQAWETLAEISINQRGEKGTTVDFGVDAETLHNYTEVAIVVVEGMELRCGPRGYDNASIICGNYKIFCEAGEGSSEYVSGSFTLPTAVQLWSAHLQHNIIAIFRETGALPINWTVTPTDFMNVRISTQGNASVKGNILLKGRKIKCI